MEKELPSIKNVGDLKGKKVIVRVDFNVPIVAGKVGDDFRIKKTLPTLEFLKEVGAKILLISHAESGSLKEVSEYLKNILPHTLVQDILSDESKKMVADLPEGGVILFENIRNHKEEEENDDAFSQSIASLGDLYVNEAFSASHRKHSSIVGIPKFLPKYAGLQFYNEVEVLSKAFNPPHPFLFILGGIKFETKVPLVKKFMNIADRVFIAGALANDFFKLRNYNIGKSIISPVSYDLDEINISPKLYVPVDVTVSKGDTSKISKPENIDSEEIVVDSGPETIALFKELLADTKFVVWNGPLGAYERGFGKCTEELACAIAESRASSIVGGGDTLAAVSKLGLENKISFLSTGGGAMLDFLANETLPGVQALIS